MLPSIIRVELAKSKMVERYVVSTPTDSLYSSRRGICFAWNTSTDTSNSLHRPKKPPVAYGHCTTSADHVRLSTKRLPGLDGELKSICQLREICLRHGKLVPHPAQETKKLGKSVSAKSRNQPIHHPAGSLSRGSIPCIRPCCRENRVEEGAEETRRDGRS